MQLTFSILSLERSPSDRLDVVLSAEEAGMVSSVWSLSLHDPADFALFLGAFSAGRTLTVTVEAE